MPFQSARDTDAEAQSAAGAKPSALHERDMATPQTKPDEAPMTPRKELNLPDIFPVYPFL
ncbi:hypothetical protein R5O87_19160 [Arthrobacter globiformis]|uniref:hypothetical protein n=1 Tax=Arthrobacter globiformis TaxID=1665 RepID=UPI00397A546E